MPFTLEYLDADVIPASHPVQQFHQFWQRLTKKQGSAVWDGALISEVPEIVPWMSVLALDEQGRYICRFCGGSYEQMIGRHHQGMYLDEALPKEALPGRVKELVDIAAGKGPLFSRTTLPFENRERISVYRGVFGFNKAPNQIDSFVLVIAPKT